MVSMTAVYKRIESLDWFLIVPVLLIMLFGLVTNFSIEGGETNTLFIKQAIFIVLAVAVIYIGSIPTYAALRGPFVSIILFPELCLYLSHCYCLHRRPTGHRVGLYSARLLYNLLRV